MSVDVIHADCLDVLPTLPACSFDAIVTDTPYHLTTGKKGGTGPASVNLNTPHGRARVTTGFMGMKWDGGDVAFRPETWAAALRVLKPGGHLLAFGGARTYHRLACAIEDGGFEIRDQIMWIYGSGFPKSLNLEDEWDGWGTALKPAHEPLVLARKPLVGTVAENVAAHGCGALNIDGCRIEPIEGARPARIKIGGTSNGIYGDGLNNSRAVEDTTQGRWPANVAHDGSDEVVAAFPDAPGQIADASSSSRKTQNVYGAMKRGNGRNGETSADSENEGVVGFKMRPGERRGDEGSAARFFYCAKASRQDRDEGLEAFTPTPTPTTDGRNTPIDNPYLRGETLRGNIHPTVKPTALMRWLVRLVTPPGGKVLDMFAGSGSTGKACELEGFDCVLIEGEADYIPIINARLAFAREERRIATAQGSLFTSETA